MAPAEEPPGGRPAFIFLNGPFNRPPDLPGRPPEGSLVLAVDGGALHALALGWPIHLILGDFDSLSPEELARARRLRPGAEVRPFPRDKDETDFELALGLLGPMGGGAGLVTVLGALGGRWDMTLANILSPLAERPRPAQGKPRVVFRDGGWDLHLLEGPGQLGLGPAAFLRRVSLVPLLGPAAGVALEGAFKYPLSGGVLRPGFTLGLSNELGPPGGRVALGSGALLVSVSPLGDEGPGKPSGLP
jgi:thiamine pyrophosphokinase